MLKKVLSSEWLRAVLSVGLIYFAFRKVDVLHLFKEFTMVPPWFVVVMILYFIMTTAMGGIRWSWLVLEKTGLKDYWNFTRAAYLGGFYGLFFPTGLAADAIKWVPLLSRYPELSKTKIAASVLIDRIIGLAAFVIVGFGALLMGQSLGYVFPPILLLVFGGLFFGTVGFFIVVFLFDYEKYFDNYFGRFTLYKRLIQVMDILKKGNRRRILNCFLLSLAAEPIWMIPTWFYSNIFGAGVSLLQVYIFIPVISLILLLPISVAGFGARENLFLFFLVPLGYAPEKVLLMSTFGGVLAVLNSLIGGLLIFIKK
ncbi:MAG: lysylphosphatidylglycerol synthase transmembrane domain-containing protein [Candidatus Shapirobacteria bacterium]|jgi:hypothetical protein